MFWISFKDKTIFKTSLLTKLSEHVAQFIGASPQGMCCVELLQNYTKNRHYIILHHSYQNRVYNIERVKGIYCNLKDVYVKTELLV